MQEIDVLRATRQFLQQRGLMGSRVIDLFTDAHPSLLGASDLRPFQRFTLAFDTTETVDAIVNTANSALQGGGWASKAPSIGA